MDYSKLFLSEALTHNVSILDSLDRRGATIDPYALILVNNKRSSVDDFSYFG